MKNIGASVRARLLRLARERGEDFQLLLTRYANERFLYRLSISPHCSRFVLKGATLFNIWIGKPHRVTRDIDLAGSGDSGENHVRDVFTDVLALKVVDDGVTFNMDSLELGPIREDQEYGGLRMVLFAWVGDAKVRLQIDVGFGDVVTPRSAAVDIPVLLDFPSPRLHAYPRETVVAEKLDAMVQLGLANSRMKDFYDLMVMSQMLEFDGELLVQGIRATFERRKTPIPRGLPTGLTPVFVDDEAKNTQWGAFVRKSSADEAGTLAAAVVAITAFVEQPIAAAGAGAEFTLHWIPGGPWR
jgi:predicted nucleotidyltransferase component of viral defense system